MYLFDALTSCRAVELTIVGKENCIKCLLEIYALHFDELW